MFEQVRADYQRHGRSLTNTAFWAILTYRYGVWANKLQPKLTRWLASKIYGFLFFIVNISSGIRLYREVTLGSDFHLIHSGNISIHPQTIIGDRCGIQHGVTIGINMERQGVPTIGDDVYIGTGAVILGPINIGDGARISANSLVIMDVPAGATAIGVPARILKYTGRSSAK